MATASFVESLFGGVEASLKRALKQAFEYVLDGNLRFGPVEHQTRATNFGAFYLTSTTAAVSTAEFSVVHGLGRKPTTAFQVLPLSAVNAQIVPLQVSRAADESRLYLKSTVVGAVISLLVE